MDSYSERKARDIFDIIKGRPPSSSKINLPIGSGKTSSYGPTDLNKLAEADALLSKAASMTVPKIPVKPRLNLPTIAEFWEKAGASLGSCPY